MFPLVSAEVEHLDLERAFTRGLIPSHYDSAGAGRSLDAFVNDYLNEEIAAEVGVDAKSVKSYWGASWNRCPPGRAAART